MINLEAQRAKFVDSFCKATGIDREFSEKVFSYISFHNNMNGLADYFSFSDNIDYMLDDDDETHKTFIGVKGMLTFGEVYKLYKEVTTS